MIATCIVRVSCQNFYFKGLGEVLALSNRFLLIFFSGSVQNNEFTIL